MKVDSSYGNNAPLWTVAFSRLLEYTQL